MVRLHNLLLQAVVAVVAETGATISKVMVSRTVATVLLLHSSSNKLVMVNRIPMVNSQPSHKATMETSNITMVITTNKVAMEVLLSNLPHRHHLVAMAALLLQKIMAVSGCCHFS